MHLRRALTIGRYRATWHHWTRLTYHRQERFRAVRERYIEHRTGTVTLRCGDGKRPSTLVICRREDFDLVWASLIRQGLRCTILRIR